MKYLILLIDPDPEIQKSLATLIPRQKAELVTAPDADTATRLCEELLPHAVIQEAHPYESPELDFLAWLEKARKGTLQGIPVMVHTHSVSPLTVKRAMALQINSYVLKPASPETLAEKLEILFKEMDARGGMSFEAPERGKPKLHVTAEGVIAGISETGCCVRSPISNPDPIRTLEYSTPFFEQVGTRAPRLHCLNSGPSGPDKVELPFTNYCLIVGWSEADRRSLRRWLLENRIERIAHDGHF
jgi:CheY-like chemotaxis protein